LPADGPIDAVASAIDARLSAIDARLSLEDQQHVCNEQQQVNRTPIARWCSCLQMHAAHYLY
jgi:hypothetical protein